LESDSKRDWKQCRARIKHFKTLYIVHRHCSDSEYQREPEERYVHEMVRSQNEVLILKEEPKRKEDERQHDIRYSQ
jgi:hypothetical protein